MLWKNLAVLIGLAWVTTTFAGNKIASETMDDALNHKIDHSSSKSQKRGVANEEARDVSSEDAAGASDPQYWNWETSEEPTADSFEPSVEDESEY